MLKYSGTCSRLAASHHLSVHHAPCLLRAGSLAIPLALRGASVSASDISAAMAGEAERRYQEAVKGAKAPKVAPKFDAMDLE